MTKSGTVINRADRSPPRSHYDFAILGGGFMGCSLAYYLQSMLPECHIALIEADGIPSEEGATYLSSGIVHHLLPSPELQLRAQWASERIENLSTETGLQSHANKLFHRVGYLSSSTPTLSPVTIDHLLPPGQRAHLSYFWGDVRGNWAWDENGGYASAEGIALTYGRAAVQRGVDLILNSRAHPREDGHLTLDRLEWNRKMQKIAVGQSSLLASTLAITCGATTMHLAEECWGEILPWQRYYAQQLRFEASPEFPPRTELTAIPVVEHLGFTIRPHGDGALLSFSELPPDPEGYRPTGGKLMGTPVGLRREYLLQMTPYLERIPCFSHSNLNLGKTARHLRGSWEILTPSGYPEFLPLGEEPHYALVAGDQGILLGLAKAYELASHLAKQPEIPWKVEKKRC